MITFSDLSVFCQLVRLSIYFFISTNCLFIPSFIFYSFIYSIFIQFFNHAFAPFQCLSIRLFTIHFFMHSFNISFIRSFVRLHDFEFYTGSYLHYSPRNYALRQSVNSARTIPEQWPIYLKKVTKTRFDNLPHSICWQSTSPSKGLGYIWQWFWV